MKHDRDRRWLRDYIAQPKHPMDLRLADGAVLVGGELVDATLHVSTGDGLITEIGSNRSASDIINAENLIVLPGIVDIHGDAFERQMMPRPGVNFSRT